MTDELPKGGEVNPADIRWPETTIVGQIHGVPGRQDEREALALLRAEVLRYLERPGCSGPARRTAMERLRWAVERAVSTSTLAR